MAESKAGHTRARYPIGNSHLRPSPSAKSHVGKAAPKPANQGGLFGLDPSKGLHLTCCTNAGSRSAMRRCATGGCGSARCAWRNLGGRGVGHVAAPAHANVAERSRQSMPRSTTTFRRGVTYKTAATSNSHAPPLSPSGAAFLRPDTWLGRGNGHWFAFV
jgi:hypothetical protein